MCCVIVWDREWRATRASKSDWALDLLEPRERVKNRGGAAHGAPPHSWKQTRVLFSSCRKQIFFSHPLHRSSSPTTRQSLCSSLYGWERDAGRGLPPCPCYCSVNTHDAPPPTLFTDATRRLSPPARANQALFVQLHGNSGTSTETLAL